MELSEAIALRITELLEKNKMNVYQLSNKSSVPRSTLSKFLSRKTKTIRLENLLYICEAFEVSLSEFFESEYFKDVEASDWKKE